MPRSASLVPRPPAVLGAVVLAAILAATAGCGGAEAGPPRLTLDHSTCDGCGMLISEARFAAGWRSKDRTAAFDDIACLLRSLDRDGQADPNAEIWVMDAEQHWLPARDAVFVMSDRLETPMAGHIQAFADRGAAAAVAAATGGVVLPDFARLRATVEERSMAEATRGEGEHHAPSR